MVLFYNVDDIIVYEELNGHMIFYIKLAENFRRISICVTNGYLFEMP